MTSPTEKEVVSLLGSAWNQFIQLPNLHPDAIREFQSHIHAAQALVAVRVASRLEPEFWNNPQNPPAPTHAFPPGSLVRINPKPVLWLNPAAADLIQAPWTPETEPVDSPFQPHPNSFP